MLDMNTIQILANCLVGIGVSLIVSLIKKIHGNPSKVVIHLINILMGGLGYGIIVYFQSHKVAYAVAAGLQTVLAAYGLYGSLGRNFVEPKVLGLKE